MPRQPREPREPRQQRQARQPKGVPAAPTRKHNKIEDSMRERLINSVFMEGLSVSETAKRYQYPVSSVRTIVSSFEQTGRIAQLPRGGNRHRVPEPIHIQWMTDQLELDPELSMDELHQRLMDRFQLDPPITKSAVQKVMAPMMAPGFRFVSVPSGPPVDDFNTPARINARQILANEIIDQHEQLADCVFVAEAGYNLRMWKRRTLKTKKKTNASAAGEGAGGGDGQSGTEKANEEEEEEEEAETREAVENDDDGDEGEGTATHARSTLPTVKNTSLVVAMDKTGVLASDLRLGGSTKDEVVEQFLLQKLITKLRTPRVIVMERARFRTRDGAAVKDACRRGNHQIIFLPPEASPFFNAAEFCFASIQSHLRKNDIRRETLNGHIHSSFNEITRTMAQTWVSTVENNLTLALNGEELTAGANVPGNGRSDPPGTGGGGSSDDGTEPHQQDTDSQL